MTAETWYVIETRGIYYNSVDYTKRYKRIEAERIVRSGYGKGPSGHDLYSMVERHG